MSKGIHVEILLDSVNPSGQRLVTWVLKYPRFVHAELMTHRQFSRNSSSSRAIPVSKLIRKIVKDPAMPVWWGKNQRGMAARTELAGWRRWIAKQFWLWSRFPAILLARMFMLVGLHKQIANRILEPWMHITVIMSTTTHANWFALRDHPDAQPEIAVLARQMRVALNQSRPTKRQHGEWHLPFVDKKEYMKYSLEECLKISTARCARVSYLTHDGKRSVKRDLKLHDHLIASDPKHASPSEHQAMALNTAERWGNFVGWKQYRKTLENEAALEETYDGS